MDQKQKNSPYIVTEWQWLELQLKLFSLQYSADLFSQWYNFPSEDFPQDGKIVCAIFAKHIQDMLESNASKEEQLEYYEGWAEGARQTVADIVNKLPILSKEFDVIDDMVISIRDNYGMGSSSICEFHGNKVIWPLEKYEK